MVEAVSEKIEISESNIGKTEELLGELKMVAESANNPAEETESVVVVNEADFSPLENKKILNRVKKLHIALMKIRHVDFWRNDGTSKYLAYYLPVKDSTKRNSIFGIHLAKKSARGTLKRASEDGKKNLGDVGVKVREDALFLDDESITQKDLLKKIRNYIKERGWD